MDLTSVDFMSHKFWVIITRNVILVSLENLVFSLHYFCHPRLIKTRIHIVCDFFFLLVLRPKLIVGPTLPPSPRVGYIFGVINTNTHRPQENLLLLSKVHKYKVQGD